MKKNDEIWDQKNNDGRRTTIWSFDRICDAQ